jgi:PAS domain S-box-containing protein
MTSSAVLEIPGVRLIRQLIDAVPIPVIGIDEDFLVKIWNAAAEREFGWHAEEVLGRRNPVIPQELRSETDHLIRCALAGQQLRNVRTYRYRRDGTRADILLSCAVARDEPGIPVTAIGVYVVLNEVETAREDAERELIEREAQLRLMLDQLPAVVFTTDMDLKVTTVRGSLGAFSCMRQEVGRMVQERVDDEHGAVIEALQAVIAGAPSAKYTYECSDSVYDACVEPLRDVDGSVRGTVVAAFDVTERHRAREAVRRMAKQLTATQENERRRIARELHDEMGQHLTALFFELNLLRQELAGCATADRLNSISAVVRETTATMRRVVTDLRPAVLDDFGFCAAVRHELSALHRRSGITYDLMLPKCEPALDGDRMTALFRIFQESLTNVARHAEATHVRVWVNVVDDHVELEVSDNGRGITPDELEHAQGLGLIGVRERAWAFDGEVTIEGVPGTGTSVFVSFPTA